MSNTFKNGIHTTNKDLAVTDFKQLTQLWKQCVAAVNYIRNSGVVVPERTGTPFR